jgi:hypothetical protein
LIADLRRQHGVVVKIVRRVKTESDRLAAKDARAKAAKAKAAKAKAAKAKQPPPSAGNGKVVTLKTA